MGLVRKLICRKALICLFVVIFSLDISSANANIETNIDESVWSAIPEYLTDISSVTNTGLKTLIKTIVSKLSKL